MKIKRILTLVLALCLVAALAAGCTTSGNETGSKGTESKSGNTGTASLTVDDIYGSNATEEEITALQNSGTITVYTMHQSDVNSADWSDEMRATMDFYKKYYDLTIKWKYQAYGDDMSKFMVDYANNDAPDFIKLEYRRWLKCATRQVVYSLDELKAKGVVGLDHPEVTRYSDLAARYRVGKSNYSVGMHYVDPSLLAFNVDLFDEYKVKSPAEYYKEGTWDMDAYVKCAKELTRTLSDGTKIWGGYWRDHSYYLVCDDARMVEWNDDCTKLLLKMSDTKTIKALEVFRDCFVSGYSPTDSSYFNIGQMGMFVCDANNFAQKVSSFTFKWDVVPTPLGSNNTSGEIPGECTGNGVVNSTKNPQGVVNYCIANSIYNSVRFNQPNGVYYVSTYEGIYNKDQLDMIIASGDHIGLDIYWGVGSLSGDYKFWNAVKGGTMTIKEAFDTYQGAWQAQVDEENTYLAEALKNQK